MSNVERLWHYECYLPTMLCCTCGEPNPEATTDFIHSKWLRPLSSSALAYPTFPPIFPNTWVHSITKRHVSCEFCSFIVIPQLNCGPLHVNCLTRFSSILTVFGLMIHLLSIHTLVVAFHQGYWGRRQLDTFTGGEGYHVDVLEWWPSMHVHFHWMTSVTLETP